MSKVLSFDVSGTTIGFAILEYTNNKINFVKVDHIKPIKNDNIVLALADTRNKIVSLINSIQPDYIAVEQIVKFMAGHSSANTIIKLTTYNRMVCLAAYDYLGKPPELISVLTVRHCIKNAVGLKKVPQKEDLPDLLENILQINLPKLLNRNNKLKPENYDRSDALALAYTFIIKKLKD